MNKEVLLAYFPKMTSIRASELVKTFSSLENAWSASASDLRDSGWEGDIINEFIAWRDTVDEEALEKQLKKENIRCILQSDKEYPTLLKQIYDPPQCIFVRGELQREELALGVVGPRKYSPYGKQVTEMLVQELASHGLTIVSGLALGIDGIAHEATLRTNSKTIAVLGAGIDKATIYPRLHVNLSERIVGSGGGLVSEYPPGTHATNYTFPRRNRIIAGLSLGVLVIEAGESSGALITASCALDTNREVFAVPQNITSPNSIGVNRLLQMGAHLVTSAQDIIQVLKLEDKELQAENRSILPESPIEAKILPLLSHEPIHIDVILKQTDLPHPEITSTLTLLEMKGRIRNLGGMMYVLGR